MKWVFGIVFLCSLAASLFLFSLARLTSENIAIPLAAVGVASLFSPEGLDEEGEFEEIKKSLLASGEEIIYPIPGQPAFVTKDDLENLSVRELRLKIFRQIVEPYYLLGVDGAAAAITDDPQEQEAIKQEAWLLRFLNIDSHRLIYRSFYISLIPLLLSLAGLLYFSYRWGKLVGPGLILISVTLLPSLALFIAKLIIYRPPSDGLQSPVFVEIVPMVSRALGFIWWSGLVLGILCLLIAGFGKLFQRRLTH